MNKIQNWLKNYNENLNTENIIKSMQNDLTCLSNLDDIIYKYPNNCIKIGYPSINIIYESNLYDMSYNERETWNKLSVEERHNKILYIEFNELFENNYNLNLSEWISDKFPDLHNLVIKCHKISNTTGGSVNLISGLKDIKQLILITKEGWTEYGGLVNTKLELLYVHGYHGHASEIIVNPQMKYLILSHINGAYEQICPKIEHNSDNDKEIQKQHKTYHYRSTKNTEYQLPWIHTNEEDQYTTTDFYLLS